MERIQSLDGWRAVAIGLVLVSHLIADPDIRGTLPHAAGILGAYGLTGVQIFFAISGFVIARGLLADECEGGLSLRAFYVRRACRILPPLWLYLAVMAAFGFAPDVIRPFFFLCNVDIGPEECSWNVSHTWSLAFEEQFYLLLPGALMLGLGSRRPPLAFLACAVAIAALPLVWPLPSDGRERFFQTYLVILGGVWVALRGIGVPFRPLWVAVAVATLAVEPHLHEERYAGVLFGLVQLTHVVLLPAAVLVLVFSIRGKWISAAPLAYFGRISYSVYLWQELATNPDAVMTAVERALATLGAIAGSVVSYHTLEAFFRARGRRWSEALKKKGRTRRQPFWLRRRWLKLPRPRAPPRSRARPSAAERRWGTRRCA